LVTSINGIGNCTVICISVGLYVLADGKSKKIKAAMIRRS